LLFNNPSHMILKTLCLYFENISNIFHPNVANVTTATEKLSDLTLEISLIVTLQNLLELNTREGYDTRHVHKLFYR